MTYMLVAMLAFVAMTLLMATQASAAVPAVADGNESLTVAADGDGDQLEISVDHDGDRPATVDVTAVEDSYAGAGTYEVAPGESLTLPWPDDAVVLRVEVTTRGASATATITFERVTCGSHAAVVVTGVDEAATVRGHELEGAPVAFDVPRLDCPAASDRPLPVDPADGSADDDERQSETRKEREDDDPHERAHATYNETDETVEEAYEDGRELAWSNYESAYRTAIATYDATHGRLWSGYESARGTVRDAYENRPDPQETVEHARGDAERVREGAEDDADRIHEDAERDAGRVHEDAEGAVDRIHEDAERDAERVREDAEGAVDRVVDDALNATDGDDDGNESGTPTPALPDDASVDAGAGADVSRDGTAVAANASVGVEIRAGDRTASVFRNASVGSDGDVAVPLDGLTP